MTPATRQEFSPPPGALAFLNSLGAGEVRHKANRALLEHLLVTYSLLVSWRHDEPVALAGLLHSIYGTVAFDEPCVAPTDREKVRAVIGEEAERLAYLFSAMDRERFLETLGSDVVADRFRGEDINITGDETRHMCEILFANEFDLAIAKKGAGRPDRIEKKLAPVYARLEPYLSPGARAAYGAAIRRS